MSKTKQQFISSPILTRARLRVKFIIAASPMAADALAAAVAAGTRIDTLEEQLLAISGKLQTLITAAAAGVGGTGGGSGSGEVVALVEVEVVVLVEALALAVAVETRRYLNNGSWTPLVSTNFTVTSPFLFCNPGETDVMNSRN